MPFDTAAALALADAGAIVFAKGLKDLVKAAEDEVRESWERVTEEKRHLEWREESLKGASATIQEQRNDLADLQALLAGEAARLVEASNRLEAERRTFEEDRRTWGENVVHFNVSGETEVAMSRATLEQCADSMLAASLSGRWSLQKDSNGRIFVDFPPKLFVPLVEYMQSRSIEDPEMPTPVPTFETFELEAQFRRMLQYYGLFEWVYKPEKVDFSVLLGDRHEYAVLPSCSPSEATAGQDMQDVTISVPSGWEILSTGTEGFDAAIVELTEQCWGAHTLCVQNGEGGFDSYRTAVRSVGGPPGSLFQADIDWLEKMEGGGCRVRFRGPSGRLVIRTIHDALCLWKAA